MAHPFESRCVANNARYAAAFTAGELAAQPRQRAVVVTCMDARIDPAALLGLAPGDAHVLRNAGGVVTDDVIRSLAISQRLLGTREIVIVQHTDCGMTKFREDELKARIEADAGLRPPFALEAFADVHDEVRQSIRRVQASPYLLETGLVSGFVYDVASGRLAAVQASG